MLIKNINQGIVIYPSEMKTYPFRLTGECSWQDYLYIQKVKTTKSPSTGEWINKVWYIHIMEYYSVIKRKEVLIDGTT